MLKKIVIIISSIFVLLLEAASVLIFTAGPELPPGTDAIIDRVLKSELPEQVRGSSGYADSSGVKIWYESIGPKGPAKGDILLIMGITNDALAWPDYFIRQFTGAGYRVIRYDHRGTGMSDWMVNWKQKPYTLEDMARDGLAIMDKLGIARAHVVGISMGGMIAQQTAIAHPDRIITLTSIMSTGYIMDPELPRIPFPFLKNLALTGIRYAIIGTERSMIKLAIAMRMLCRNDTLSDAEIRGVAESVLYDLRKRKGYNFDASAQHQAAVKASGSRYDRLPSIQAPCLVIHGTADLLMPIAHGRKCAKLMPHAATLWVDDMGHDISPKHSGVVSARIIEFIGNR